MANQYTVVAAAVVTTTTTTTTTTETRHTKLTCERSEGNKYGGKMNSLNENFDFQRSTDFKLLNRILGKYNN